MSEGVVNNQVAVGCLLLLFIFVKVNAPASACKSLAVCSPQW